MSPARWRSRHSTPLRASQSALAKLLSEHADADVDVYASGIYYGGVDHAKEATGYLRDGFTRVKMKIGRMSIADDLARVRAVRDAIGKVQLMADGNGAYGIESALAIAPALRDLGVIWFEEPFPLDDLDAYAALRERRIIDVAAGESLDWKSLERLIDVVDVIQPNVATCGGVMVTIAILKDAAARGVRPAIHAWGTPVMTAVSLHVAAACAQFGIRPIVEIDRTPNPLRAIARDFEVRNGVVAVPVRPGLGLDVDESAVAAFQVRSAA